MPIRRDAIRKIYNVLSNNGYAQDYNTFEAAFAGNDHYANRKKVYDLLTANGADIGSSYEDFMRRIYFDAPQPAAKQQATAAATQKAATQQAAAAKTATPAQPAQAGTPLTEQDRIRMSNEVWQMGQKAQQGISDSNARMKRMTESTTQKGRDRRYAAEWQARAAGTPTSVAGFNTAPRAPQGEGNGGRQQQPVQSEESPQPYGVVYENGVAKTQWLLPDGTLTTSLVDANQAEYNARTARLAHQFRDRMKENGLDPNKAEDVQRQQQLDYEAPLRKAIEEEWSQAEDADRAADEKYIHDVAKSRSGLLAQMANTDPNGLAMNTPDDFHRDVEREVERRKTFDLEKMANMVYQKMPQAYRDKQLQFYSQYYRQHPSELKGRTAEKAAADALQREVYGAVYERAVQARMPKSKVEAFMRKVADQPLLSPHIMAGTIAGSITGSHGLDEAERGAMARYGKEHRWIDIAGTVGNMALDPITYISGGVGSLIGKGALAVGGRLMARRTAVGVGSRLFGSTLGGRVAAGVAGGAGNFATFEGLGEAEHQFRYGGHTNAQTGENEGYSVGAVLEAANHGLLLGGVTGALSPLLGNVADKWVKATSNTVGKIAIRAGELGTSTLAEGTIFSIPDWVSGNGNAMDVWTDNMAMMLGFKAQHLVKSAPKRIADLMPIKHPRNMQERNHNRMNFNERVRVVLDASPSDMQFTHDELAELRQNGFVKLADLFSRKARPTSKANAKLSDIPYAETEEFREDNPDWKPEKKRPELEGYEAMQLLMNSKNISQAARAKAYYILTGHGLPMGTVASYDTTKSLDGKTWVVNSKTRDGEVVTSRRFTDEASAKKEEDKIMRQAELNTIDVGESYVDYQADEKRMDAAIDAVVPGADHAVVRAYYHAVKSGDKEMVDAYGKQVEAIDAFLEKNKKLTDDMRPAAIRTNISKATGIDVDEAIKKTPSKRSKAEQDAVETYVNELYKDVDLSGEQQSAPSSAQTNAHLTWQQAEEGDPNAQTVVREAQSRMDEAYNHCKELFEDEASIMAKLRDNPLALASHPGLSDAQRAAVMEYVNAKAVRDGIHEAAAEGVDDRIREVQELVDRRTNKDTGMVHPVVMRKTGKRAYIVKGRVEQKPDGTIDEENSERSIIICDDETGEYSFTSPDQIYAMDAPVDPQTEIDAATEQIRAEADAKLGGNTQSQAEADAAAEADATPPVPEYGVNYTFTLHDAEGNPIHGEVQGVNEDGVEIHTDVPFNGKRVQVLPAEDFESVIETLSDASGNEVWAKHTEPAPAEEGTPPEAEATQYQRGTRFELDGKQCMVASVENGKVLYYEAGSIELHTMELSDFEGKMKDGDVNILTDEAEAEAQPEEPAYKVGSRIEINGVEYQVVGIDDNDVTLLTKNNITLKWDRALLDKDLGTGDSKVLPEEKTPETPQAQGTETPAIPMKEDGNPDYEATTPQQAHAHIYSDPELSPEEADAYVAANLAEAEKNLKKVQGKAPKMGTDLRKYKEAKAKHQADVEAAQRSVDFWNAVKAEHDRTETERLRTEEQQRKEEKRQETGSNTAAPQIREKWNAAPKVDGMADEIVLPDGTKLKGHYVLTEAGAATPSHNAAEGFTKSEGYPADENGNTVNDRDYERDTDAQRVTRGIAGRYDQRAMQQPVVVSRDGVVLSGNGRTMAGELAARDNTDGAYVSYLAEHADRYGFTPEQVKGMNHPRVVFVPDAEMPYTADTFARFNHVEQKAQSNTENAVKLGKTVPDYVYGRLTDRLANFNTLAELYQDSRAVADTFRDLVDAGIVQENQLPQFFDGGQLSDAGKALIESVLVGKAFEANPEAVRQITAIRSMRQAMATAITEVVRNSRLGNGYDLSAELAAAVDLVYKARQSGMKLGQRVSIHARTGNLFPEEDGATVADYNNAMVMILADVINDNRVTQLKKVLATYNQNAEPFSLGQADIFEGMRSKEDILKDTYNFLNNGNEKQPTEPKRPETRPSGTDEAENPPAAGGSQEGGADEGGVKPEGEADAGEGEAPQPAEEPTTHAATITKQKKAKSKAEEQPKWTVRPENMPEDPAAKKAVELMSAYCQTDEQLFAIDEKLYGIENPNSDEARRLKEEARRLRAHCRQLEAEHETAIDAMNGTQLAAYRKWMIPGDFTDDYYSRNRWEKAKQTAGEVVQGMTPLYKRALQAVRAGDKDALKKQLDKAGKMFSSQTDDVLAAIVENLDHTKKIVKKRGDKEAAELVKKFADRAKSELEKVEQATAAERKQSVDVNKHMPTAEEVAVEEAALEQGLNLIDQHGKPVDQFVVGLAKWANEQGMHIDGTSPETSYEDLYIACEDGFDVMTFVPNSITQGKERNVVIYHPEYNGKALDPHKIYELEAEFNKGRDQKHSAIDWMETYGESAFYDYKTAKEFQAFVDAAVAERKRTAEAEAEQRGGNEAVEQTADAVRSDTEPQQPAVAEEPAKQEETLSAKIAAASAEVNTEPTEAQKEAGNDKKGHVQVGTFDITIEQPQGSVRRGTDANGKAWESKMHNTYGYFRGTEGVDGDHIDVFLSNDIDGWNGRKVYVVDQYNPDGNFDEHKVMLGFNDMDEAKSDYLANYEKGWEDGRRIVVSATNLEDFEKWIDSSHRKTKPFAEYAGVKKETTGVGSMGIGGSIGNEKNKGYSITPATYTNKKGKTSDVSLLTFNGGLTADQERAVNEFAKEKLSGQRFAKSRGWKDRESGGWMFRSEEDARKAGAMVNDPQAVADAQPLTAEELREAAGDTKKPTRKDTVTAEKPAAPANEPKPDATPAPVKTETAPKPAGKKKLTITDEMKKDEDVLRDLLGIGDDEVNDDVMFRDPDTLTPQQKRQVYNAGVNYALGYFDQGYVTFPEFAQAMVSRLGYRIKPWLKSFYEGAKRIPGFDQKIFTPSEDVDAFDVENFDKPNGSGIFAAAQMKNEEGKAQAAASQAEKELKEKRNEQRKEAERKENGLKLRPATEDDLDNAPVVYYEGEPHHIIMLQREGTLDGKSRITDVLLDNGKAALIEELQVEDKGGEQEGPATEASGFGQFQTAYDEFIDAIENKGMLPNINTLKNIVAQTKRRLTLLEKGAATAISSDADLKRHEEAVRNLTHKINAYQAMVDYVAKRMKETDGKDEQPAKHERSEVHRNFATAVKNDMLAALANGTKPYRSIVDLRKRAKALGMDVDDEGRTDILLQELVEDGLVSAAREVVSRYGRDSKECYGLVCKLYDMQPTIGARSSNRIKMQQYSTPLPMAWNAGRFAMHGKDGGRVLEPTAGNGMLVFTVPAGQVHANELDDTRLANLREQGFAAVTQQDATEPFEGGQQYDVIIANPPFGKREAAEYDGKLIGGLDPQITLNALASMKDDGRAAIIIGGNMEYASNGAIKNMKPFFTYLYDHYNVKGVVDMDGGLYAKQGTTYPTRMILIDGRRTAEERTQTAVYPPTKEHAVRKAETFEDLYDIVEQITNSNNKTNGTEILRSQQRRPLSDAVGRTGKSDGQPHSREHRPNDGDGRRGGREHVVEVAQSGGKGLLRGEHRQDSVDGTHQRPAGGNHGGGSRGASGPVVPGVEGVGVRGRGVGLTPKTESDSEPKAPEKRTITDEKLSYRPHNSAFSLESVAPAAMVEAMDRTLAQIEQKEGNIDEFVTRELGYDTIDEMHNALAAEQVDSVAMAIHQMKQGQAMIIGDQTGVGKGRQMAALIRWAVKQGKKPIFVTQKADLFSDIYRDLVDTGSGDLVPFIFNSPSGQENRGEMVDANGNIVFKGLSDAKMKKVMESGKLPDGYDYIVLTYSQVNSGDEISQAEAKLAAKASGKRAKKKSEGGKSTAKATFLRKLAEDNYLFFDESHTAAGESNTGAYLQSIMRKAKAATFASATFAKRPDSMPLYAIRTAMSKANVSASALIEIITKGGVTLQEIMSRELTNAGQMVRRERDMKGVKTDWVTISEPETVKRARENYDRTITAFNAIIKFQKDYVAPMVEALDKELAAYASSAGIKRGTKRLGLENVPFASKTYNYTKQLMLALKSKAIVDYVEAEIKAGRHPVIALESTMESSIEGYEPGAVISNPTFAASLLRGLDSVMQYTTYDENGKQVHHRYDPDDLGEEGKKAYYALKKLIIDSTSDIFISPLDEIIERLHEKGYRVGELTGRKLYVERDEEGNVAVRKRTDKDKKRMQRQFNSGELDVLILNKSASTGISLHASEHFADRRQRTMIIAQPLSDINDYMQMIGRIDRTGQVHRGYYINLGLPVPAENRFLMMLSTKLKSLNANTTTSQDSESTDVEAPDLLNKYGSQVIIEYLRDNPDIYEKMGLPLRKKGGESGGDDMKNRVKPSELNDYKPQEDDARRVTGSVALLPTEDQAAFYDDVVRRYNDLINYLNETGTNDLKITVMPLRAKTIARKVASHGADPEGTNPFAHNSYVEKVEMDVLRKPLKAAEVSKVIATVSKGMEPAEHKRHIIETVKAEAQAKIEAENARYEKELQKAEEDIARRTEKIKAQKKLSEQEKIQAIEDFTANTKARIYSRHQWNIARIRTDQQSLTATLGMFEEGKSYFVPDNPDSPSLGYGSDAIFCGFKAKDSKITASTTLAVFATLDGRRRVEIKVSNGGALDNIRNMTLSNYDAVRQTTLDNWDNQIPTETRKTGYILTGNILQAIDATKSMDGRGYTGQLISYTDMEGNIHDGILMPDRWKPSSLRSAGVPIAARMQQILDFKQYLDIISSDRKVELSGTNLPRMYYLTVPRTKKEGAKFFENQTLLDAANGNYFYPYRGKLRADIPADRIESAVLELNRLGVMLPDDETDADGETKFREGTLLQSGSYFSGGGLLEEGLKNYLDPKIAVEFSQKIAGVYADNLGRHIVTADVRDVDPAKLAEKLDKPVEYFHASPVCKNFSRAKRDAGEVEMDKETAQSTASFISTNRPKVVTIENVKGYQGSEALRIITDELTRQGYDWDMDVYNAADFGGYTSRERLIVRAVRDGKLPPKPEPLPASGRKHGWLEAVEDLIPTLHEKRSGVPEWMDKRLKAEGIDWRNIDRPLYVFGQGNNATSVPHAFADELLPTLRTKGGDVIIIPDGRVLRAEPRVLARLAGLSDDYHMPTTDDLAHTIVGNGIPTQLSQGVIGPLLKNVIHGGKHSPADAMAARVQELSESLHTPVHIISTDAEVSALPTKRQRAQKGSYNTRTGEVTVVIPNNADLADVENTVLHEVVGHDGIHVLFPTEEKLNNALDELYRVSEGTIQDTINRMAQKMYDAEVDRQREKMRKEHEANGEDPNASYYADMAAAHAEANKKREKFRRDATEEYGADLAGRIGEGGFEKMSAQEKSFWGRLKSMLQRALNRLLDGLKITSRHKWTDKDWAFVLHEAYKRKKNGGNPTVFDVADTAVMREKTGFGEDQHFRDGNDEEYNKAMARDTYERRVSSGLYQFREAMQDSMLGLKAAMESILKAEGKNKVHIEDIPGFENPYLGENRLSSVNQAECHEFSRQLFKPMLEEVAKLAKTADQRAELTDYMMAKHGLERNDVMARRAAQKQVDQELGDALKKAEEAALQNPNAQVQQAYMDAQRRYDNRFDELYEKNRERDYAGLTALTGKASVADAETEAQKMVTDYEAAHDTTELWDKVSAVNQATLQKTYDCGIISKDTFDEISQMYDNYIPLRGFDETTAEETYAYLNARDSAFNAPIKTAKGRKSKADDPFANMEAMAESAIMQGNRNVLVKQKFLNFAQNHPSDLVSVSDLWLWHNDASDEWQVINSGDLQGTERIEEDDTPAEVERKMNDFEEAMKQAAASDPDHYRKQKDYPNVPYRVVQKHDLREHQVLVKRNGRDYILTINGNPRAAQALNGQTNPDNDVSGVSGRIMHWGEVINRQLSAFYTTRNPDFIVSNFFRDMLYSNTMAYIKESPTYAIRFNKNFARFNPARLERLISKWEEGKLNPSDPTEEMFRQFMMNGGETGYAIVRDIEKRKNAIKTELKNFNSKNPLKHAWEYLKDFFDFYSRSAENCARFAAFVTSREMKRSIDRSIFDAKEISVNFNKKGSGAKFLRATGQTKAGNVGAFTSGFGRSLYVFWNAALQGTTNFGRQAKRHPKKFLAGAASMFTLGAVLAWIGKDDEDNAYYNIPEYVRRSNIVIKIPGTKQYFKIPLPVEYRSLYGMGELATSAVSGAERYTSGELASQIAGLTSQMLPIDFMEGGGGFHAAIPSWAKPTTEAQLNVSWTGMPIYKETPFNKDDPEWTKAFKRTNTYLVDASKWLNEKTGGDDYTKGAVDINPAKVEYILNGTFGGLTSTVDKLVKMGETVFGDREYNPRDILFVNRLVTAGDEQTANRAANNEFFRIKENSERLRKRLNRYENATGSGRHDYSAKMKELKNTEDYRIMEVYEYYKPDIDAVIKEMKDPNTSDDKQMRSQEELNQLKAKMLRKVEKVRKGK